MSKLKSLILAVLFLATLAPAWAGPGPTAVVEGFFSALHESRYADAWSFLDSGSQAFIASEWSKGSGLSESQMTELLNQNSPQLKAYWDNFRTNMKADAYAKSSYQLLEQEAESAIVVCQLGSKRAELQAVNRDGRWGFDYFTTFWAE